MRARTGVRGAPGGGGHGRRGPAGGDDERDDDAGGGDERGQDHLTGDGEGAAAGDGGGSHQDRYRGGRARPGGAGGGGGGSPRSRSRELAQLDRLGALGQILRRRLALLVELERVPGSHERPHRVVDRRVHLGVADDRRRFGQLGVQLGDAGDGRVGDRRPLRPSTQRLGDGLRLVVVPAGCGRRLGASLGELGDPGGGAGQPGRERVGLDGLGGAPLERRPLRLGHQVGAGLGGVDEAAVRGGRLGQPRAPPPRSRSSARRSGFTALRRSVPTASPLNERSRSSAAPAVDSALRVVAACCR